MDKHPQVRHSEQPVAFYFQDEMTAEAVRVSNVSIAANTILTLLKLAAGLLAHSAAMLSDAIHTASDVLSTLIVIVSVKAAGKASDEDHQYGHERFESLGALLLSAMLAVTGLGIGWSGISKILDSGRSGITPPGALALYAAIISIACKEWMYWYTIAAAKKVNSEALRADAWHHRSDAISSIGALLGIGAAMMGWPVLDPVASLLICALIVKTAVEIGLDAIGKLIDKSCSKEVTDRMKAVAKEQEGVIDVAEMKTRLFGAKVYVDATILCHKEQTLEQAHSIAEEVHFAIEKEFPEVKHCNVHVDPA